MNQAALDSTLEILERSARPTVLLGPVNPETLRAVRRLSALLGAALLMTPDAKSLVDYTEQQGVFSFGAPELARRISEETDLVLAFCPLSEFECRLGRALRGRAVIHVAEQVTDVGRNITPAASFVGPSASVARALARGLRRRARLRPRRTRWFEDWIEQRPAPRGTPERAGFIHPVAAIRALEAALPRRARMCVDITSGALHAYEHLRLLASQRLFSSIEQSACMGEALMASIGVRLASDRPTLVVTGDWCYAMSPAEIHTAVEHGLGRFVIVVWANGGGAFIGEGIRQQGLQVPDAAWRWRVSPDFASIARSWGASGVRVTDAATLRREVARGLRAKRPLLVEAIVDPLVSVPAQDRFLTLDGADS